MFSSKIIPNTFYLILLLQYSCCLLQECEATEMDIISKDAVVVTSTSSPILKHLSRTGVFDSDVKISRTKPEVEIPDKVLQSYSYKFPKDGEIFEKAEDLKTNSTTNAFDVTRNASKDVVVSTNPTIDLSKLVHSKLASALKTRLHQMIAMAFRKYGTASISSEVKSNITSKSTETHSEHMTNSSNKESEGTPRSKPGDNVSATGRQFVFHPYLPYGKDVSPDEKISIGDVLPVKMVKFFKGMVEDAPWEQMFQKMVRMIVDQFVDKIIEKMFAHKDDDHDAWRSLDGGPSKSSWSLPKTVLTYVVRSRRSTEGKAKSEPSQDWIEKDSSSANRVSKEDRSKTKEPTEEDSWLDSILDYLFPDDPKAVDDFEEDTRKRREANQQSQDSNNQAAKDSNNQLAQDSHNQQSQDSNNRPSKDSSNQPLEDISNQPSKDSNSGPLRDNLPSQDGNNQPSQVISKHPSQDSNNGPSQDSNDQPSEDGNSQLSGIMRSFLARYLKFQPEQLSPESMNAILKDSIRHKTSEIISQDNSNDEDSKLSVGASSSTSKNTALHPKLTESVAVPAKTSLRAKRSTTTDDADKDEDEDRLWQAANRRTRPSNRKSREDCSLRRACNAGRLLSRLPSVQDITMQLKAYGNEPHWDALLWGMTKKRCSRIFCKRQRSPKGTRHHWDGVEKRLHRKGAPASRSSRLRLEESDLTTIFPV